MNVYNNISYTRRPFSVPGATTYYLVLLFLTNIYIYFINTYHLESSLYDALALHRHDHNILLLLLQGLETGHQELKLSLFYSQDRGNNV